MNPQLKRLCLTATLALLPFAGVVAQECNGESWTPDSRFIIHSDEVYDTQTRLMWKRCLVGQNWDGTTCQGVPFYDDWDAINKTVGSKAPDWHLPTIEELVSIRSGNKFSFDADKKFGPVLTGCWENAFNQTIFPGDQAKVIGANPPQNETYSRKAYFVDFINGSISGGGNKGVHSYPVYASARLVKYPTTGDWTNSPALMEQAIAENKLQKYRSAFKNSISSSDYSAFIKNYSANDPDKLISLARTKMAESLARERLEQRNAYRAAFRDASSSSDYAAFISKYSGNDPDKLIPQAKKKMAAMQKQEQEQARIAAAKQAQEERERAAQQARAEREAQEATARACDRLYQGKPVSWDIHWCDMWGCRPGTVEGIIIGVGKGVASVRKSDDGKISERDCSLYK